MWQLAGHRLKQHLIDACILGARQIWPTTSVNIEPTNICNLACSICPQSNGLSRPQGTMSLDTFKLIVSACQPSVTTMAMYLHGEPFLNPDLPDMVALAAEKGIRVSIFTNGIPITEAVWRRILNVKVTKPGRNRGASLVRLKDRDPISSEVGYAENTIRAASVVFSMDLLSAEGYQRIKGADLFSSASAQLATLARLNAEQPRPIRMTLRSIYGGEDRNSVRFALGKWLSMPGISDMQLTHPIPWPGRKDADILGSRLLPEGSDFLCPQIWNSPSIYWGGSVSPCSYDYMGECIIGDIHKNSLTEIVNSEAARRFRRHHLLGNRHRIPLCAECFLPRFLTDIITIRATEYQKMDEPGKESLLSRIERLRLQLWDDFPTQAPG